jgi:hypothetical protein
MLYRVILTRNNEYVTTLHRCKTKQTSFVNFRKKIEENEKVIFPRKFVNYNGIKPVKYKIYCVKDTEEDDDFRTVRDALGRVSVEKPLFDIWTVLDSADYQLEEEFWVYGRDAKTDRPTIHGIIKLIMKNIGVVKTNKVIVVVHNKLLIYNEESFDMVVCKCKKDAQRLHHALAKAAKNNKIKNLLFMGTASKANISKMYDLIVEKTGWRIQKVRRTSTRP